MVPEDTFLLLLESCLEETLPLLPASFPQAEPRTRFQSEVQAEAAATGTAAKAGTPRRSGTRHKVAAGEGDRAAAMEQTLDRADPEGAEEADFLAVLVLAAPATRTVVEVLPVPEQQIKDFPAAAVRREAPAVCQQEFFPASLVPVFNIRQEPQTLFMVLLEHPAQ